MYHYRNISSTTQVLIGFGEVQPGAEIVTEEEIHNQNFERIHKKKEKPQKSKK